MTTTAGNYRNAAGTQFPQIMLSYADGGLYQYGVCIDLSYRPIVFKRSIATGLVVSTYDLSADTNALGTGGVLGNGTAAAGIVPLSSAENSNSSHYGYALGVDDQDRIHIVGNSLAETPHYIRSAPGDITTWTNLSWKSTTVANAGNHPLTTATGGGYSTYNTFDRLSNGTLMWHLDQRDTAGAGSNAQGKDNLAYYLPVGTSTWQKMIPGSGSTVGEFMQSGTTAPDRVYFSGTCVDPRPSGDRVWVMGIWRDDWTDVTTQRCPFIIYSDDITNAASWKRVDGTTQPMPITAANCGYSATSNVLVGGATIPQFHGTYAVMSGRIAIDSLGFPHVMMKAGGTVNDQYHVWWDGSIWQDEFTYANTAYPGIFNIRGTNYLYMYQATGRMKIKSITATGAVNFFFGGTVPAPSGTQIGFLLPYPDPVRLRQGWLDLLIPDGDTPKVYSFGSHNRAYAS